MSKARMLVAEVFLALLLNVTAGLLNRPDAILASKWGWFFFFLHLTYVLLSGEKVKAKAFGIRKSLKGGRLVLSYVIVAACGAVLAMLYWRGIGIAYRALFTAESLGASSQPIPAQKPPTLESLFDTDFSHVMKMSGDWSISTVKDGVLAKGRTNTYWDFMAKVKFIAFFVPRSDHSYTAARALVNQVDKEFANKQGQLSAQAHGFGTSTDLKDLVFSGRVFLYHADTFTLRQLADLVDLYKAKGMALEFMGPDYLATQVGAWHRKHDKKQSDWNIIDGGFDDRK